MTQKAEAGIRVSDVAKDLVWAATFCSRCVGSGPGTQPTEAGCDLVRRIGRAAVYVLLALLPLHYPLVLYHPGLKYWKECLVLTLGCQVLVVVFGTRTVFLRRKWIQRLSKNRAFWLYVGWTVVAAVLHPSALSLKGVAGYSLYSVVAVAVMVNFDLHQAVSLLRLVSFVGSVVALSSLYQFFFDPTLVGLIEPVHWIPGFELSQVRAGSILGGSPIVTGMYLAMMVPLAVALLKLEVGRCVRWLHALEAGVMVAALGATVTRAAWLQLVSTLVLFGVLRAFGKKPEVDVAKSVGLLCLTFAVAAVALTAYIGSSEVELPPLVAAGNEGRLERWRTAFGLLDVEQLFLGYGPGVSWPQFVFDEPESVIIIEKLLEETAAARASTESYALMLLLDLGVGGMVAFYLQLWRWVEVASHVGRRLQGRQSFELLSWALASVLAAMMVSTVVCISLTSWQVCALFWAYIGVIPVLFETRRSHGRTTSSATGEDVESWRGGRAAWGHP